MSDWYALVDAAQDARLQALIERSADRDCLFAGEIDPAMAPACPYIVRLDEREPLLGIWRTHGAGRNWGLLVESDLALQPLRRLFRRFLQAKLPDGSIVLFRFYDPRVFATYIASAPPEQVADWFNGVRQYVAEADGLSHAFRLRHGHLFDGDAPVRELA